MSQRDKALGALSVHSCHTVLGFLPRVLAIGNKKVSATFHLAVVSGRSHSDLLKGSDLTRYFTHSAKLRSTAFP